MKVRLFDFFYHLSGMFYWGNVSCRDSLKNVCSGRITFLSPKMISTLTSNIVVLTDIFKAEKKRIQEFTVEW